MQPANRQFVMSLALIPGIGGRTLVRILTRMDLHGHTPHEFLKLSTEALIESYGLGKKQALSITNGGLNQDRVVEIESRLKKLNVRLITAADAAYPVRLEQFDANAPAGLFCYGNFALLDKPTFCVLSSRDTTPRGLNVIEKLTEEGVFRSEIPVCGHDRPEYQRSAIVPLRWGSPRILCFDRGMFHVLGDDLNQEPFRSARLWRYEFDAKTDLAISPFRPDAGFKGVHNQVRDRLIASLSDRLDFVEVRSGGNMEKLAVQGLKVGRSVRVSDRSENALTLRAQGAELLVDA